MLMEMQNWMRRKDKEEEVCQRKFSGEPNNSGVGNQPNMAYRLKLPATTPIHNVFHVSQLKNVTTHPVAALPLPWFLEGDMVLHVEPEQALLKRHLLNGSYEVLIKWKNLPTCDNTWEAYESICHQFPFFHLEDKVLGRVTMYPVSLNGINVGQRMGKRSNLYCGQVA